MTEDKKPMKIEFAPGCFDSFEGTQEELDALQEQILAMFESGEIEAQATELNLDELMEDDPDFAEVIMEALMRDETPKRLH